MVRGNIPPLSPILLKSRFSHRLPFLQNPQYAFLNFSRREHFPEPGHGPSFTTKKMIAEPITGPLFG